MELDKFVDAMKAIGQEWDAGLCDTCHAQFVNAVVRSFRKGDLNDDIPAPEWLSMFAKRCKEVRKTIKCYAADPLI